MVNIQTTGVGGRSEQAARWLNEQVQAHPGGVFLWAAPRGAVRDLWQANVVPMLHQFTTLDNPIVSNNVAARSVRYHNGAIVQAASKDDPNRIRGIQLDGAAIQIEPDAFTLQVQTQIRNARNAGILGIF